jgi:FAD/FMN-containing dehydrogenase
VLGLEVVLADGRVWNGLRSLRKDATGYDLAQLFIGSEGTLGIVTRAVLGLRPATPYEQSALAALAGLDHLAPALALAQRAAGDRLSAIELVPGTGIDRFVGRTGGTRPLATVTDHYLLIRLADVAPVTDTLAGLLAEAADAGHVLDAVVAATPEQETALWTLRDELSPVLGWPDHEHHALKLDTGVPVGRVAEFVTGVHQRAAELAPMAHCYAFGHVGDGNIHVSILPITEEAVAPFLAVRDELASRLDRFVLDLGGTLSAEHGIGTLLRDRITAQKPMVEWELMRRIKEAIDPHDLFNPGVMLPPR